MYFLNDSVKLTDKAASMFTNSSLKKRMKELEILFLGFSSNRPLIFSHHFPSSCERRAFFISIYMLLIEYSYLKKHHFCHIYFLSVSCVKTQKCVCVKRTAFSLSFQILKTQCIQILTFSLRCKYLKPTA